MGGRRENKALKQIDLGFFDGSVVKTLSASAGDTGSIPDLGRPYTLQSNQAHAPQLLSLYSRAWGWQLLSPCAATLSPCAATTETCATQSMCSATRKATSMRSLSTAIREQPLLLLLLPCRFSRVRLCATPQTAAHQASRPWDSPGKNTGVGCHFLLQCMKVKSESEVAQSCLTLATPWTTAYQAPPSMGFSRQEYWSGVPLPSPREQPLLTTIRESPHSEK